MWLCYITFFLVRSYIALDPSVDRFSASTIPPPLFSLFFWLFFLLILYFYRKMFPSSIFAGPPSLKTSGYVTWSKINLFLRRFVQSLLLVSWPTYLNITGVSNGTGIFYTIDSGINGSSPGILGYISGIAVFSAGNLGSSLTVYRYERYTETLKQPS